MEDSGAKGRRFSRTREDFTCEHCGYVVIGNGYTDHCPRCLFGKHVDVMPGDRAEACRGLMEPLHAVYKDNGYTIYYKCMKCGMQRRFKYAPDDNVELLLKLLG
jgi:rubrerythrin